MFVQYHYWHCRKNGMSEDYKCEVCGVFLVEHLGMRGLCANVEALKEQVISLQKDCSELKDRNMILFNGVAFGLYEVEKKLSEGGKIGRKNGKWCLFDKDENVICKGEHLHNLAISLSNK